MALASAIEPIDVRFQWRPQVRDPDDEMVLEAEINGGADPLVTHNVVDFAPAGIRFGVPILRPADILRRLRS